MPPLARLRPWVATAGATRTGRVALDVAVAVALLVVAHAAYRGSTGVPQMCDSAYSMAAAERLATVGSLDLAPAIPPDPAAVRALPCYQDGGELPYQLIRPPTAPGRVYYGYPLGSVVLSAPWVRYTAQTRGPSAFDAAGYLSPSGDTSLQLRLAARVSAVVVVLLYVIGRFALPVWAAGLVAAGFAFGSPVWSTLARSLWSHTWAVAWLAAAIGLLFAARRVTRPTWRSDLILGIGLGAALFWAAFCRQHTAISAVAIGGYLTLFHRRLLVITILTGGVWTAGLVAASLHAFGTPMPPSVYSAGTIDGHDPLDRLFWLLASPSRGLIVFCPYLAVVGAMLVAYRRAIPDRALLLPCGLAVGMHTAVFACYNGWHAGSSYGPRYFCDVIPWFALATVLAVRGLLDAPGPAARKLVPAAALVAAFGWGLFVHGRGANAKPAWFWNHRATAVGQEEAVKEWRYPQFLAGLTFEVEPDGAIRERN